LSRKDITRGKAQVALGLVAATWGRRASQAEPLPRQLTCIVARLASAANLRPDIVDGARRRYADLTYKGGATIAVTLHAPKTVVGKYAGDAIEIALVFDRKPGPVAGKRTARTATATEHSCIREFCRNPLNALAQIRYPLRRCDKPFS